MLSNMRWLEVFRLRHCNACTRLSSGLAVFLPSEDETTRSLGRRYSTQQRVIPAKDYYYHGPPCKYHLVATTKNNQRFGGELLAKYSAKLEEKKRETAAPDPGEKPNHDQLQTVANKLQYALERTFTHPMDYSIYHPNIVFIDNIRNLRTEGIAKYMQQVALLKTVGHFKFALVRFEILNMSVSHEEGRITIRWRIKGLSGMRVMLKFWKYKIWRWRELMQQQDTWHDGISYFDVGGDAKIFQHIADKVMEDKHRGLNEKTARGSVPLAATVGALATVYPSPSLFYTRGSSKSSTPALEGISSSTGTT